jgi:hypothetical protein
MSWTPEDSAIKVTPEIKKALETASTEQIKEIMARAAVDQGLVRRDIFSPDVLIPTPLASAAPKQIAKTVTVDGVKHIIEGATEMELAQNETTLYRKLFAQPTVAAQTEEQPRNERGQFVSAEDAATKAELELAFKRGDISTSDYLQRSGAVADYLAKEGVSIDALKATVDQNQAASYEKSWQQATAEFLSHSDWPGLESNRARLGATILELGLVDSPSVESLQRAYDHMKKNNLLVENPQTVQAQKIANAKTVAELQAVVGYRGTTALWGK